MRHLAATLLLAAALSFLPSLVLAAKPNNQACLGHDFSGYAQARILGGFVSAVASTTQGLGSEVQAHLAGLVPDEVIENSCNDPS
jgi:hypothetical protein